MSELSGAEDRVAGFGPFDGPRARARACAAKAESPPGEEPRAITDRLLDPFAWAFAAALGAAFGPPIGAVALRSRIAEMFLEPLADARIMPPWLLESIPVLAPTAIIAALGWGLCIRRAQPLARTPRGTALLWILAGITLPISMGWILRILR